MRLKLATLLTATTLLTGCFECEPETDATTSGQGGLVDGSVIGAPTPGTAADFVANVGDRVFFDFDRSTVRADGQDTLQKQAAWLKKYPTVMVTIQGHCDERGTTEYNLALGERRANAAKKVLMSLGIADSRIKVISYGKEHPIVAGHNEEAWAQNRVAITVID